jgi:tyrosine-protein kinase Etk/Wzc
VELLNQFNLERLQSQSRARRRFAAERKDQAEQELHEAQAQHLKFLQSNRQYDASPLLSFEQNRLSAQVELRQNLVQTLTREYEEARIAEVRDTPVLTTIDPAIPPDRRTSPKRKLVVLLAMVASGFTALALVYLGEYQRVARLEHESQYRDFLQAWRDAKAGLRRALRIRNPR